MIGTELSAQSDYFDDNDSSKLQNPSFISDYSKVETKEESYIDPKDVKLNTYNKEIKKKTKPVNSDMLIPISIEQPKSFFYKKIGNTFAFFGNIYGDPILIIGPHWPLFVIVLTVLTFCTFIFLKFFWSKLPTLFKITTLLVYLIFSSSYIYTALINPGYPKHDLDSTTGEPRNKFYFCKICKLWVNRDKKTEHCYDCDICVEGNDHHCIWTGKCIGAKNLITFYIFVVSVFLMIGNFFFSMINLQIKKKTK